jgi:hypothetical protein
MTVMIGKKKKKTEMLQTKIILVLSNQVSKGNSVTMFAIEREVS